MIEAEDIPELRDPDRYKAAMPNVLDLLEARRREHCPLAALHPILLFCPECGLEAWHDTR